MFSKELQILDRNTVKYMIDELQDELNDTKNQLNTANNTISKLQEEIDRLKKDQQ